MGHYALHLARGLRCRTDIADLRYFAGWRWLADPEQALAANQVLAVAQRRIPFKSLAFKLYQLARDAAFRWQSRSLHGYLFHAPNYILPTFADPGIATIHDLSYLRYPQFHPRRRIAYLERRLPDTLRRAGGLISDSAFIRQEIITLLRVNPHGYHRCCWALIPGFAYGQLLKFVQFSTATGWPTTFLTFWWWRPSNRARIWPARSPPTPGCPLRFDNDTRWRWPERPAG